MNLNDDYMNLCSGCGVSVQVLKYCCGSPRTVEVLLNAYSHLKVTDAWVESVSSEALKASLLNNKFKKLGPF